MPRTPQTHIGQGSISNMQIMPLIPKAVNANLGIGVTSGAGNIDVSAASVIQFNTDCTIYLNAEKTYTTDISAPFTHECYDCDTIHVDGIVSYILG